MTGQINVNKIAARTGTAITVESGHVITQPGSVIQVLQTVDDTVTTYSTTETWTDAGLLSVAITPKSATSKIMVEYCIHNSTHDATVAHRITRNGTGIGLGAATGNRFGSTTRTGRIRGGDENHISPPATMKFLDSPATTSTLTYKVQLRIQTGEGAITMNTSANNPDNAYTYGSVTISTITVTEIAQ